MEADDLIDGATTNSPETSSWLTMGDAVAAEDQAELDWHRSRADHVPMQHAQCNVSRFSRWVTEAHAQRERAEKAEAALAADVVARTEILRANVEDGRFDLAFSGEGAAVVAASLVELYRTGGGENYLEMQFHSRDTREQFVVAIQRVAGLTPHQLRAQAETDAAGLREQNEALRAELDLAIQMLESTDRECWPEGGTTRFGRMAGHFRARLSAIDKGEG